MEFLSMADPSDQISEAHRWLVFAEEDLAYGKLGMAGFPRAAAWSFQQAAEKAFKSLLIFKGQTPRRTHDLLALFNSIVALSADLEKLRADVLCLAELAASSRYPDDLAPIEKPEIEKFAESAQAIVVRVRLDLNDGRAEGGGRRTGDGKEERLKVGKLKLGKGGVV